MARKLAETFATIDEEFAVENPMSRSREVETQDMPPVETFPVADEEFAVENPTTSQNNSDETYPAPATQQHKSRNFTATLSPELGSVLRSNLSQSAEKLNSIGKRNKHRRKQGSKKPAGT